MGQKIHFQRCCLHTFFRVPLGPLASPILFFWLKTSISSLRQHLCSVGKFSLLSKRQTIFWILSLFVVVIFCSRRYLTDFGPFNALSSFSQDVMSGANIEIAFQFNTLLPFSFPSPISRYIFLLRKRERFSLRCFLLLSFFFLGQGQKYKEGNFGIFVTLMAPPRGAEI